jgi:acyl-CoA thioester hydrolase
MQGVLQNPTAWSARAHGTLRPMGRSFRHRIRVRYGECDPQGVVFNANYFAYFDIAITELWREAFGRYDAMLEAGTDLVAGEATARFLAPAGFDDELDLVAHVKRLGNTSLVTAIQVWRDNTLVVDGEIRHVFVDPETKRKKAMPDDIRRGLEPYSEGVEAGV